MRLARLLLVLATVLATSFPAAAAPVEKPGTPPKKVEAALSLGVSTDPAGAAALPAEPHTAEGHPFLVRLRASWSEIEHPVGEYDWSALQPLVETLHRRGYRVVVCLSGTHPGHVPSGGPPSPFEGDSVPAWTSFVKSAVRTLGPAVFAYEILDAPERMAPEMYAFVLKNSALEARAEARRDGFQVLVAEGAVAADRMDWQKELWKQDVDAYVDVLPVRIRAGDAPGTTRRRIEEFFAASVEHPPAPALWAEVHTESDVRPLLESVAEALSAPVAAVLAVVPAQTELPVDATSWLLGMHRLVGQGYASAPTAGLSLRDSVGKEIVGGRVLAALLRGEDLTSLAVYEGPPDAANSARGWLVTGAPVARNARTVDPATGRSLRVPQGPAPGGRGKALHVPLARYPLAATWQRGVPGPGGMELPPEEVEIESSRGLTAAEIIARYQEVQRVQDEHLERWTARARTEFHFKFAQSGSSVDVAIESNYFWERGGSLEWEQTDYYINGNRVPWKNIPELPLIQPEKIITLPLDLTLDKTYAYRLVGEGDIGGRRAYILAFEPADANTTTSLYRGRVWIDAKNFVRLKASVVQTGLESPVLANEERDFYRAVEGPGGRTYWMLDHIDGQQVWNAGGRNLVVRRQLRFQKYRINPPVEEFRTVKKQAYASNHQVLRDTDKGFRYLERKPDGSRVVKETVDTSQLFVAGGAFEDSSTGGVTPLAGVNYFDYDFAHRNVQVNVLFGGVLAFVNATKPDLFGGKMDAALDVTGLAIRFDDKVFEGDREKVLERIRTRPQNLSLRLGIPVGEFLKFHLIGGLGFRSYAEDTDVRHLFDDLRNRTTNPLDLEFVLPPDHRVYTGTLEAEYNRRGYTVSVSASRSRRSKWAPWGLYDRQAGTFCTTDPGLTACTPVGDPPALRSYTRWGATAFKEWYLPKFQKIRGEVNYLDGSDLDRFSRYEFGMFGSTRLSGFSGSGVRFDRGFAARAGYSFNLFDVIRLDATLESARVRRKGTGESDQSFTGVGLSGNVVGPWKTIFSLSYGRSVASDIPDLEGKNEFLFLVLKLFG